MERSPMLPTSVSLAAALLEFRIIEPRVIWVLDHDGSVVERRTLEVVRRSLWRQLPCWYRMGVNGWRSGQVDGRDALWHLAPAHSVHCLRSDRPTTDRRE